MVQDAVGAETAPGLREDMDHAGYAEATPR